MKPNINLSEHTAIASCPSAHEEPRAFCHGIARQGAVRQASNQSGKFYRDRFYRGKFYRGASPESTGTNSANNANNATLRTTRRSSITKDFCPSLAGQFERIMNVCGASSSDFLE
ncbi:MAG: hypothetical protein HY847_02220 [Betaproteobacteria bacterium]|nr:hypothetical protein [Betaproteobacteria bacterium]